MQVHYLEIVTQEVSNTCATYSELYGIKFSDEIPELGNARKAELGNGGIIGIRAPLHESEEPVIRPYMLVENIDSAIETVVSTGGEIIHPPLEIPGFGMFAIYLQGGNQLGLWQV
ncbi:VOC family protein [Aliikangiella sp. IMCC44653]